LKEKRVFGTETETFRTVPREISAGNYYGKRAYLHYNIKVKIRRHELKELLMKLTWAFPRE
jgi:hypothetical protein